MKSFFSALLLLSCVATASAATPFFDTNPAEKLITLGARIGLNTSNYTTNSRYLLDYNENSWGLGFDAGVICNINFRDFISIQPGVFYQSRSGNYSYCTVMDKDKNSFLVQMGHTRSYNLNIPVMAAFHFNISDDIRWNVELGPYFNFCLGSKKFQRVSVASSAFVDPAYLFTVKPNSADIGMKLGTTLTLFSNYEVGVHYMAGFTDYWQNYKSEGAHVDYTGKSKAWTFTVGYNF